MNPFEKTIPGPGQESVWDYPRPPAVRRCDKRVRIILQGEILADTIGALCVLETSHPPTYYLPPADIEMQWLREVPGTSICEWKGAASYYDIVVGEQRNAGAAWYYPDPKPAAEQIRDRVAFWRGVDVSG